VAKHPSEPLGGKASARNTLAAKHPPKTTITMATTTPS
jgi:hypothetical protein